MKKTYLPFIIFISILFNSCFGLKIDIQMNRNGSGKLTLEYRISETLTNIGNYEGNEHLPVIPAGRADWQRTISRIEGARLASFSSSQKGQDTVTTVIINFANPQALLAVLDPALKKSDITIDNNSGVFNLILNEAISKEYDKNLMDLARSAFADYNFSITFNGPANSTLLITDGNGNPTSPSVALNVVLSGRKVSLSIGVMDLIEVDGGLGIQVNW